MALRYSSHLRKRMLGQTTELVTNGTFDADVASWNATGQTISFDSGKLRFNANAAAVGVAKQEVSVRRGHFHKLTYTCYMDSAAEGVQIIVRSYGSSAYNSGGTLLFESPVHTNTSTSNYTAGFTVPDGASDTHVDVYLVNLSVAGTGSGDYGWFDNISIVDMHKSFQDVLDCGVLRFYSGTQPSSADSAQQGTFLCEVDASAGAATTFLQFDSATSPSSNTVTISKKSTQTWSGAAENAVTANAGWFRLCRHDDPQTDDSSNQLYPRLDGTVGTSGANINLSSVSVANGAVISISTFTLTFPYQ